MIKKMFIAAFIAMLALPAWAEELPDTVWTKPANGKCWGAEFTPDGKKIIVAIFGHFEEWDTETGEKLREFEGGFDSDIISYDISYDGSRIVAVDLKEVAVSS